MNAPVLIPAARSLRTAFDQLAPDRDTASDGWIGDTAHQHEESDHNPDETASVPIHDADKVNEVHAVDVDNDFNVFGLTMMMVVLFLVARCRSGQERRLRYIIYDRKIWEASNGWRSRGYNGKSPHTEHAHFSLSYDSVLEASTISWRLELIPVALSADDKKWISDEIEKVANKVVDRMRSDPDGAISQGDRGRLITSLRQSDAFRTFLTETIQDAMLNHDKGGA